MAEVRIAAEARTELGKGGARRTRRAGKVPAVLYGHGTAPVHISLPAREFSHALKGGSNVLLEISLNGDAQLALPRSVQRHPVRGHVEHVDLLIVRRGEKVRVEVPVQVVGDVVSGGLLDQQLMTVNVEAEATNIPTGFEVSIDGLEIGSGIHASQIQLPAGVILHTDPEAVVVHVMAAPTAEQIEAELAGAEAELGAGAAGAEAIAEAKAEAEGVAASPEPTGEGDVVPDTESGEGGPPAGE